MTLINLHVARDRQAARAWCDTMHAIDGKPVGNCAKFALVPHLPAVILCRGSLPFAFLINQGVQLTSTSGFEHLCELLPSICRAARTDHLRVVGPLDGAHAPEVLAIGLSERVGGYAAVSCRDDFATTCNLAPGALHICPAPPTFVLPADVAPAPEQMVELAEFQLLGLRREHPDVCTGSGGKLIAIALAVDGAVTIRTIATLSASAADPAARRARAWWASAA